MLKGFLVDQGAVYIWQCDLLCVYSSLLYFTSDFCANIAFFIFASLRLT